MRVVQVTTQSSGGPVDHAADVAVTLATRGHESHVVGPWTPRTPAAARAGVEWHVHDVADKRDVTGALAVVRRLHRLQPDIMHLQDRRAGWLGRLLAPFLRGTGCVYTLHGLPDGLADRLPGNVRAAPHRRRDSWYYLHGERWVSRWGRAETVVPSAAVAGFATDDVRLPAARVHVVPNGVDPTAYAGPASDGRGRCRPTVVWVGVMAEVKRLDLLLEAVAAVPDVRLVLAGDGPLRPRVEADVERLGMGERVCLLGRVEDVPGVLDAADVFVLSSAAENLPLALLQAMASGLPVVATAVGGVPEVVRDGVEGVLVPAGDASALAEALQKVCADPDRLRLGVAGRARVEKAFTVGACVDGLERVYTRARSDVAREKEC